MPSFLEIYNFLQKLLHRERLACNEMYLQGVECDAYDVCPAALEARKNNFECRREVTAEFSCGTHVECNTFAPDGLCGIEQVNFVVKSTDKGEEGFVLIYNLFLSIDPETGLIIPDSQNVISADSRPFVSFSDLDDVKDSKRVRVISQEGDFFSVRRVFSPDNIEFS